MIRIPVNPSPDLTYSTSQLRLNILIIVSAFRVRFVPAVHFLVPFSATIYLYDMHILPIGTLLDNIFNGSWFWVQRRKYGLSENGQKYIVYGIFLKNRYSGLYLDHVKVCGQDIEEKERVGT